LYAEELVSHAIAKIRKFSISQIPVLKDGKFVGSIDESKLFQTLVDNPEMRDAPISSIMNAAYPIVKEATTLEELSKLISKNSPAVLVELNNGNHHIVTKYDIISAMV